MAIEYLNNKEFEQSINNFQRSKKTKARCELMLEDIRGRIARKTKKKPEEVQTLFERIQQSYNEEVGIFNDNQVDLANKFLLLATHLTQYPAFHYGFQCNLIEPEDAVQEGVVICFEKIDRFDPKRGSKAFNFFTTIVANHYRQVYRTSKNYNELKKRYHIHQHQKNSKIIVKNGKETIIYK